MFELVHLRKKGLNKVFGILEIEIMELAWKLKKCTVRDMHRILSQKRDLAYTTVMTVADRLHKKGFLSRLKKQFVYVYQPILSRKQLEQSLMKEVFQQMLADFREPAISCLVQLAEVEADEEEEWQNLFKRIKRLKQASPHA